MGGCCGRWRVTVDLLFSFCRISLRDMFPDARIAAAGAAAVAACVQTGSASPTVPIISLTLAVTASFAAPTALHARLLWSHRPLFAFLCLCQVTFLSALTAKQSVRSITFQSDHKCVCALFVLPMIIQFHVIYLCFCVICLSGISSEILLCKYKFSTLGKTVADAPFL